MSGGRFNLPDLDVSGGRTHRIELLGVDINSVRALGLIPTASTEPSRESLETNFEGLRVSSSQTTLGDLTFLVPSTYNPIIDRMYVRFLVKSSGDTDTPTIDATLFRKRAGTALSADLDPTISAAIPTDTVNAAWVEITVEGQALNPGDAVTFVFTTGAHTTDNVDVYAVKVEYFGDEAAFYEITGR
ncbi:MAG TPA: hypothetical protein ENH62_05300 [Marinobacter sp.]|uniref:Uncharacterized protein n=1 Tax=marine sediment metagenome TaxID=412755 RepID=A0A0F9TBV0_9ZZZZ|nr:hypothetical protein [Marinobacter sp.]